MNETDKRVTSRITQPISEVSEMVSEELPAETPEPASAQQAPTSEPSLPLSTRLIRLQSLALVSGALIVGYLIFALYQLLGAHTVFESAQLQRVLNQRYAKEVLLASSGVPVNYDKTAKEWARALTVLTHGGEFKTDSGDPAIRVRPPHGLSRYRASLDQLSALREKIVRQSADFMESNRLSRHREQLFDEVYRQSLELQAAGDALVQTYDRHLNSGVSWWDVNAVAVELAERQRMLIQQHVKEVLFVAHGIPADYQATRLRLYETARILAEGGSIAVDGGDAIVVPAPGSADVRFNLEQQKTAIERFTAVSNQFLMLANEGVERSIQLKNLSDLTSEFHTAATGLLSDYQGFFARRVHRATRDAVLAGLLAAAFALFLLWSFARKYVDGPAAGLVAALQALRSGRQPDRQPDSAESGPLAEVAREINLCSDAWRSRHDWLERFLAADRAAALEDPGMSDPLTARLYQWYKSQPSDSATPAPRWSSADSENDITIVGRLPDAETPPFAQDSELLDQLIQRANELQTQNEHLAEVRSELEGEAKRLRDARLLDRESHDRLEEENARLSDQIRDQSLVVETLRQQIQALQRAETAFESGAQEISRVNTELADALARQSEDLGRLRVKLTEAEFELQKREELLGVETDRREELQYKFGRLEASLEASVSAARSDQAEARRELGALRQKISESEAQVEELRFELLKREERVQTEAGQREALSTQVEQLMADLEAASAELRAEKLAAQSRIEALTQSLHQAEQDTERFRQDALERQAAISEDARREKNSLESLAQSLRADLANREELLQAEIRRREELWARAEELRHELDASAHAHQQALKDQRDILDGVRREKDSLESLTQSLRSEWASQEGLLRTEIQREKDSLESARADWGLERASMEERCRGLNDAHQRLLRDQTELEARRKSLDLAVAELRMELDAAASDRAADAARHERAVSDLQETLGAQTAVLEALRTDLAQTLVRHAAEITSKDNALQLADQNLQLREAELWQSRKLLSDLQRELAATQLEVQSLQQTRDSQTLLVNRLSSELTDLGARFESKTAELQSAEGIRRELEGRMDLSQREHAETQQRLDAELAALKAAYFEKCQALSLAEDRLAATRSALKLTLEELQERAKP